MNQNIYYSVMLFLLMINSISFANEMDLPELLVDRSGKEVNTCEQWETVRRPEILELFRKNVYGRMPVGKPENISFNVVEIENNAMDGMATRKQVEICYSGPGGKGKIDLAVFIPNDKPGPVRGFLLICNRSPKNIDSSRKYKSHYWPAEKIVKRGYMAAAFHYADADPDFHDGFKNGVHGIFDKQYEERPDDAWGAIAAWAWGASRVMDYFEKDVDIDSQKIAVVGHSRGGKAALWCGAEDRRFALTVSNDSGCTGAALASRKQGELVKNINDSFPHWFCTNYKSYNGKEVEMPVDQHMLIALMAPRLVYVASATDDSWADPKGEFLSCVNAEPVFELYGLSGLTASDMPKPNTPIQGEGIAYHIRKGGHNLTSYDWSCYLDYADKCWSKNQ